MKRRGFTLLETLLALALAGLLMVGLNTFVFSMGELWGRNADLRLFDQHIRAVTRFLQHELRTAAHPPAASAAAPAFTLAEIRTQSGMTETLLTFELFEGSRLFVWPGQPLPEVVCSLSVREGAGLLVHWHSRIEKEFAEQPPRETVVSSLVTGLGYDYYDAEFKNWKKENYPRRNAQGEYDAPQRLRLTFTYRTRSQEVLIVLPSLTQGVPAF